MFQLILLEEASAKFKRKAFEVLPYFISKVLKPLVTTSYELGPAAGATGATTFGFNAATRSAKFPVNASTAAAYLVSSATSLAVSRPLFLINISTAGTAIASLFTPVAAALTVLAIAPAPVTIVTNLATNGSNAANPSTPRTTSTPAPTAGAILAATCNAFTASFSAAFKKLSKLVTRLILFSFCNFCFWKSAYGRIFLRCRP